MPRQGTLLLVLLALLAPGAPALDRYHLSEIEHQRFERLTQSLRCLVCQNESLADSQAPLAQDLKRRLASMIQQGAPDEAIQKAMVKRYGHFVDYRPPMNLQTLGLWALPLSVSSALVAWSLRRRRRPFTRKT